MSLREDFDKARTQILDILDSLDKKIQEYDSEVEKILKESEQYTHSKTIATSVTQSEVDDDLAIRRALKPKEDASSIIFKTLLTKIGELVTNATGIKINNFAPQNDEIIQTLLGNIVYYEAKAEKQGLKVSTLRMYQINVLIKAVSEVGQLSQMGQSSREEFTFKLSTLLNKFMKEHSIKNIKDYEATSKFIDTANVLTDDKVESFITELFHHLAGAMYVSELSDKYITDENIRKLILIFVRLAISIEQTALSEAKDTYAFDLPTYESRVAKPAIEQCFQEFIGVEMTMKANIMFAQEFSAMKFNLFKEPLHHYEEVIRFLTLEGKGYPYPSLDDVIGDGTKTVEDVVNLVAGIRRIYVNICSNKSINSLSRRDTSLAFANQVLRDFVLKEKEVITGIGKLSYDKKRDIIVEPILAKAIEELISPSISKTLLQGYTEEVANLLLGYVSSDDGLYARTEVKTYLLDNKLIELAQLSC